MGKLDRVESVSAAGEIIGGRAEEERFWHDTVAHCRTVLTLLAEQLTQQAEAGVVREPLMEELTRTAELMNEAINKLANLGAVTISL